MQNKAEFKYDLTLTIFWSRIFNLHFEKFSITSFLTENNICVLKLIDVLLYNEIYHWEMFWKYLLEKSGSNTLIWWWS